MESQNLSSHHTKDYLNKYIQHHKDQYARKSQQEFIGQNLDHEEYRHCCMDYWRKHSLLVIASVIGAGIALNYFNESFAQQAKQIRNESW